MMHRPLYPPAILGVLGSGQLGRMFTQSATKLGYTVHVYSPSLDTPAKMVGAVEFVGNYSDTQKLSEFLDSIDALTFEFENIPDEALNFIDEYIETEGLRVYPSTFAIRTSNNRTKEKNFFKSIGIPVTNFLPLKGEISSITDLSNIKFPAILKTNKFGYDGKGQRKFLSREEFLNFQVATSQFDHILEEIVPFDLEISVIGARFYNGKMFIYPPSKNIHVNHILDETIHPASISGKLLKEAEDLTKNLLEKLNYIGVLGVEFFVKGELLIGNEFAPRPHNSGHFTIDGANYSQFDLQLFALTGIIEDLNLETHPTVMKNIIGEPFFNDKDLYPYYLKNPNYKIHLYQKKEILPGRKLGHINYLGEYKDKLFLF
jgi:5-(carboxyamino)imidazole ribonucleotide synthase